MDELKRGKKRCIMLTLLVFGLLILLHTLLSEYADVMYGLITTIAGIAVIEAITCFEDGKSIGKGIIVVALELLIIWGMGVKFFNISGAFGSFCGGVFVQCLYLYWRTNGKK